MPRLLPKYWLEQLGALVLLGACWGALVLYSYCIRSAEDLFDYHMSLATPFWLFCVAVAPFLITSKTARWLAVSRVLARVMAIVGSLLFGGVIAMVVSVFIHVPEQVLNGIALAWAAVFAAVSWNELPKAFHDRNLART